MYEYRKLTPEQRAEVLQNRIARGYPLHAPPHPLGGQHVYLLTAACYQHHRHLDTAFRRQEVLDLFRSRLVALGFDLQAWVILPNHYHLLVDAGEFPPPSPETVGHGKTSRQTLRRSLRANAVPGALTAEYSH